MLFHGSHSFHDEWMQTLALCVLLIPTVATLSLSMLVSLCHLLKKSPSFLAASPRCFPHDHYCFHLCNTPCYGSPNLSLITIINGLVMHYMP
jgi:hypothetical protein